MASCRDEAKAPYDAPPRKPANENGWRIGEHSRPRVHDLCVAERWAPRLQDNWGPGPNAVCVNVQPARHLANSLGMSLPSIRQSVRHNVNFPTRLASAALALAMLSSTGCAVSRGPEATDDYMDDATITGQVRARIVDNPTVSWTRFSVQTLDGTVMLSGFAKNTVEKETAEQIARDVIGVKTVNNQIEVRP